MSLSAAEIRGVVALLSRALFRAHVQKVLSPASGDRVVLALRTPGETHLVQVVARSGATRLGRIQRKPLLADRPHPFVMLLRKELVGCAHAQIDQIGSDRAVSWSFQHASGQRKLVCELTSRHANLFWLGENDRIIGSLFPNRSQRRPLVPGEEYQPPIPRSVAKSEASRFEPEPELEQRIEEFYLEREACEQLDRKRQRVRRIGGAAARHLDRLTIGLSGDLKKAIDAERYASWGHLLKANLSRLEKGAKSVELCDFEGRPTRIPLDPRRGAVENMQQLFAKAKRFHRAVPAIEKRLSAVREDRAWVQGRIEEIETADTARLEPLAEELVRRFPKLARRGSLGADSAPARLPYREFGLSCGRSARVGRSAKDNEVLLTQHAKPNDLWLHARGASGSHVVVPMGRGEDPNAELLIDAAHLAAFHSSLRGEQDVEVCYTRRRYVQKPRGAPPGLVRLLREKTILVRIEGDRLRRLLDETKKEG